MSLEGELFVDTRFSTWQNRNVRTIVVNSRAKIASQRSISNAIGAAKPYDRIELVGGEYFETLSISFPIELVASEGEDVKVSFRGTCLTVATDCAAFISDIEFISKGKQRNDAAVLVTAGTPEFSRCRISSVMISGKGNPSLVRCKIQDSANGVGLRVVDAGGGYIDSCEINAHACVCVEVDTTGDLTVKHCTLSQPQSDLTVVAVQAVMSNTSRYVDTTQRGSSSVSVQDDPRLYCRQVRFIENKILQREGLPYSAVATAQAQALGIPSVASQVPSGLAPIPVLSTFGAACCALVSHEAQPLFEGNEFAEGSVGMILERLGSAILKSNIFRMQRSCGIFFLLPETDAIPPASSPTSSSFNRQSMRITDHNFFDRCRIGIDVQCGAEGAGAIFHTDAEVPMRIAKTVPRPASDQVQHSWFAGISAFHDGYLKDLPGRIDQLKANAMQYPGQDIQALLKDPLWLPGISDRTDQAIIAVGALSEFLLTLIEDVFLAHPHVMRQLQPSRAQDTPSGYLATTHAGSTFGFLTALLDDPMAYRPSLRRLPAATALSISAATPVVCKRSANETLERLRGGFGIHIIETKFLNCTLCGIRFGNLGRGLVDSCEFDRCGSAAVFSESGSFPMILGCRFQNNVESSIQVSNDADPLIICNAFESSASAGIAVRHFSRGLILGNVIGGSEAYGIHLDDCSSTVIAHNHVTRNKAGGAKIHSGSRPLLIANQFTGNFGPQLEVSSFACPTVVKNTIVSGGGAGLLFTDCGGGCVRGNTCSFHTSDGIVIELDADPVLEHNLIANNKGNGIRVRNNGGGSILRNHIDANELYNIRLEEGGTAVVRANVIEGGFLGGISVAEEGSGLVEKNLITKNGLANVSIRGRHTAPLVIRNEIRECYSGVGVVCFEDAGGELIQNCISSNKTCGVMMSSSAVTVVAKNRVFDETSGLVITSSSKGRVVENDIYDVHGAGIIIQERGDAEIIRNSITNCTLCGILAASDACGLADGNTISSCGFGVIAGNSMGVVNPCAPPPPSSTTADGASVTSPLTAGAPSALKSKPGTAKKSGASVAPAVPARAVCELVKNSIVDCRDGGVLLESGATAVFRENDIRRNGRFGVLCDVEFRAKRLAAIIEKHKRAAANAEANGSGGRGGGGTTTTSKAPSPLEMLMHPSCVSASVGGGSTLMERNTITLHSEANIAVLQHSHNTFTFRNNTITESSCGVMVRNQSFLAELSNNVLQYLHEGVVFETGGRGLVKENVITECAFVGIYVASGGEPTVLSNKISRCGSSGVLCDAGSRGFIRSCLVNQSYCGMVVYVSSSSDARGQSMSSTVLIEDNDIYENQLHGVLLLGASHCAPIRSIRMVAPSSSSSQGEGAEGESKPVTPRGAGKHAHHAAELQAFYQVIREGEPNFAIIRRNKMHRNRFFGVFREKFQMLELSEEDSAEVAQAESDGVTAIGGGDQQLNMTPEKQSLAKGVKRPHNTIQSPTVIKHNRKQQSNQSGGGGGGSTTTTCYSDDSNLNTIILTHPSLIENEIFENSFGVGVGQESDLVAWKSNIHHNSFFGVVLRSTSVPIFVDCSISSNGLAGVYAARFCMGSLDRCCITENNMLCRDVTLERQARSLATFVVSQHYVYSVLEEEGVWLKPKGASNDGQQLLSGSNGQLMLHAFRQLTTLLEVHDVVLDGSCTVLSDVVAAPSNVLSIASSILPNPFYSAAVSSPSATASSASSMSFAFSVMDACNTAPITDGGIGVWLEEGSQVHITNGEISRHRHCGVLFSRGILSHHHVIRQSSERRQQDLTLGNAAASLKSIAKCRYASANPGVLFSHQTLVNNAATAGSDSSIFDRTATFLDATAMTGSPQKGFGDSSPGDKTGTSSSGTGVGSSNNGSSAMLPNGSGAPLIRGCRIKNNESDGVRIQLFHALVASVAASSATTTAAAASSSSAGSAMLQKKTSEKLKNQRSKSDLKTQHQQEPSEDHPVLSTKRSSVVSFANHHPLRRSVPLPHLFDADVASLTFAVVIEDNDIGDNKGRGVLCEHVAEINCSTVIPNRVTLNEWFDEQAVNIATENDAMLRSVSNNNALRASSTRQKPISHLVVETGRLTSVRHGNIRLNRFRNNERSHAELTTRFVVYTGDRHRTLLHMDTTFDKAAAKSMFSFTSLIQVPLVYDLTLCPVPGVFLLDENSFQRANIGVRYSGIIGTQCSRVRANHFEGLETAAIVLDGPRSAACIGDGNVFENNRIGIWFLRSVITTVLTDRHRDGKQPTPTTIESSGSTLSSSKVFKNVFTNNAVASIFVEGLRGGAGENDSLSIVPGLLPVPVLFKNEFRSHGGESCGVLLSGSFAGACVSTNTFHHNAVGVVLSNGCGTRLPLASQGSTTSRNVVLEYNKFHNNVIGCVVSGGAASLFQHNWLRANRWSGLLVAEVDTSVTIRNCLVEGHTDAEVMNCPLQSLLSVVGTSSQRDGNRSSMLSIGDTRTRVSVSLPTAEQPSLSSEITPCGIIIDPLSGCEGEQVLFLNNDIGLDVVRDVDPSQRGYLDTMSPRGGGGGGVPKVTVGVVHFSNCIFRGNHFAGVNVRGAPKREVEMPQAGEAPSAVVAAERLRLLRSTHADALSHRGSHSVTIEQSLFESNGAIRGGDVIFKRFGHALLKDSLFLSVLRSLESGYGTVSSSLILGTSAEVGMVIEHGGRTRFVENVIRERHLGVRGETGSYGLVERNLMTNGRIGLETEPFSSTMMRENTVALMDDCGALVNGGNVECNTIFVCPVGVIIRSVNGNNQQQQQDQTRLVRKPSSVAPNGTSTSSSVAPLSSVPLQIDAAETTYELQLVGNFVHTCDTDGILVSGGGRIEGNHVSNNKTNVNVLTPNTQPDSPNSSSSADGKQQLASTGVPRIHQNYIFDGQLGVVLVPNSVCFLTQNHVFDNSISGVVCQAKANGVVEANHISSAAEHGALEIAPECNCQVHHNTVRNQFSPAYNKGLQQQRVKERQKESTAFSITMSTTDERITRAQADFRSLSQSLAQMYGRLTETTVTTATISDIFSAGDGGASGVRQTASSGGVRRPRALSFSNFDSVTSALTHLGGDDDEATSTRTDLLSADANGRRPLQRLRSLQALRSKEGRGSVTATTVMKSAKRSNSMSNSDGPPGTPHSQQGAKKTDKQSRQKTQQVQERVLIHAFQRVQSGEGGGNDSVSSTSQSPATTPRDTLLLSANRVLNLIGSMFHLDEALHCSTMITSDPSEIASVFKSQSPGTVIFIMDPEATVEKTISPADQASLVRIQRLLQSSNGGVATRSVLLAPEPVAVDFETSSTSSKKSAGRHSIGENMPLKEFLDNNVSIFSYRSLDDLESRTLPLLRQWFLSKNEELQKAQAAVAESSKKQPSTTAGSLSDRRRTVTSSVTTTSLPVISDTKLRPRSVSPPVQVKVKVSPPPRKD